VLYFTCLPYSVDNQLLAFLPLSGTVNNAEADDISTVLRLVGERGCAALLPGSNLKGCALAVNRFVPTAHFYTVAAHLERTPSPLVREVLELLATCLRSPA
jgi:hypothetical protein